MEFTTHKLTATDGTTLTVNVPAGPMPTEARVAVLAAAFDRVKNPANWKLPIDANITVTRLSEIDDITDAIEFYTATEARAQFLDEGAKTNGSWSVWITAAGYYAGPAN